MTRNVFYRSEAFLGRQRNALNREKNVMHFLRLTFKQSADAQSTAAAAQGCQMAYFLRT
jgi:hypothetical protein